MMKNKTKNISVIEQFEFADIFKVEMINGKKKINRWGFFVEQEDGTIAIYRPDVKVCDPDDLPFVYDDYGPGSIEIVAAEEVTTFLNSLGNICGIAGHAVSEFTDCGWYYDTLI